MSLSVVLRPEAKADLLEARDWYEHQKLGLVYATVFLEVRGESSEDFLT